MLTKKNYEEGISILVAVFRNIEVSKESLGIWYNLMSDIDGKDFLKAVKKVCNEVKELYPGTNIVALVRERLPEKDDIQLVTSEGFEKL